VIRRAAIALLLAAGVVVAAPILLSLPGVPSFEGFGAFGLLEWLDPITRLCALTAAVVVAVRRLARRNATAWLAVFLPILVLLLTAIHYLPFLALPDPGPGPFHELWRNMRALTCNLLATLVLSALYRGATRLRSTPPDARQAALATPAIVCTIFLSIYVLFILMPV
jgi:hypothetical protein